MSSENDTPQKTSIFKTYLKFIDSPRFFTTPFSWLYLVVAIAFLALPVYLLVQGIDNGIFKQYKDGASAGQFIEGGKTVFAFILTLIAATVAAIVSFIVSWNGKKNEKTEKLNIDFIIDVCADIQALIIKALAHFIAVFGFFAGLFALIFGNKLFNHLGLSMVQGEVGAIVMLMVGSVLLGYGLVWFSKLFKFLFAYISRVIVKVVVQIFRFVVLHAIGTIYHFIAHVLRQLFDYIFVLIQAIVDFTVNGLRVIIALVARLGRFLLAYARSPFKNKDYNDAKITYNE